MLPFMRTCYHLAPLTPAALFRRGLSPAAKILDLPADAVARLSRADLQMIESFLARRLDLPLDIGAGLAAKMARSLAGKMKLEIPPGVSNETFLEALALGLREVGSPSSR